MVNAATTVRIFSRTFTPRFPSFNVRDMKLRGLIPGVIALVLGASFLAQAQFVQRQPADFRVIVGEVSDSRYSSNRYSRCTVELKFAGDAVAGALDVIKVRSKKAMDDLGEDLVQGVSGTDNPFILSEGAAKSPANPLKANVPLRNPARSARFIRFLEGDVELFIPTVASGSLIIVTDFFKFPQAPIPNPALKKLGVEVTYQTKEMYQARMKYRSPRTNVLEYAWPDSRVAARLFLSKTNNLIVRAHLQYDDGAILESKCRVFGYGMRCFELTNQPSPGTQLVIAALTPEAKQTFPFRLENIPLP